MSFHVRRDVALAGSSLCKTVSRASQDATALSSAPRSPFFSALNKHWGFPFRNQRADSSPMALMKWTRPYTDRL
jgi:hypothetical protein